MAFPLPPKASAQFAASVSQTKGDQGEESLAREAEEQLGKLVLPFIKNEGQISGKQVQYYADTFAGRIFVTGSGLTYALKAGEDGKASWALNETFVNASAFLATGKNPVTTEINYFKGDKSKWQKGVTGYEELSLGRVFQGVDVTLRAKGNNVEKIFTVEPGGDPSLITMQISAATGLAVNEQGGLAIKTDLGDVTFTAPVAYQEIDGRKSNVPVSYRVEGDHYGFSVGSYNSAYPLIIDPLLAGTYLGGGKNDSIADLVVAPDGDVYVTGYSYSTDFPDTVGENLTHYGLDTTYDVYVARLSGDLTRLKAISILGGSGNDSAINIAWSNGNVYVGGWTESGSEFPADYTAGSRGGRDGYIARFTPALTEMKATAFGGEGNEMLIAMAVRDNDGQDEIVAVGSTQLKSGTYSPTFPIVGEAFQTTAASAYITKFNNDLQIVASTFFGGSLPTDLKSVDFASDGRIIVGGATQAQNTAIPVSPGVFDGSFGDAARDGFIAILNSNLTAEGAKATFVGSDGKVETVNKLKYITDADGSSYIYAVGSCNKGSFAEEQITASYGDAANAALDDVFAIKLTADLTTRAGLTYIGAANSDQVKDIEIAPTGQVILGGLTKSSDYPITEGQLSVNGAYNGFVIILNSNFTIDKSSALPSFLDLTSLALDEQGQVILAGQGTTVSGNLEGLPRAYKKTATSDTTKDTLIYKVNPAVLMAASETEAPTWTANEVSISDVGPDNLNLSWPAAADNSSIDHYLIYQNGSIIDQTPGDITQYHAIGLLPDTDYTFKIEAMDSFGNWTETALESAPVHTPLSSAPVWPDGSLTADYTDTFDHLQLRWPAAADDGTVTGYRIYKDGLEVTEAVYGYNVTDAVYYSDVYSLDGDKSYTLKVEAQDNDGYLSHTGPSVTLRTHKAPDIYSPYWPVGKVQLAYLYTSLNSARITWPAALDNEGVDHYHVIFSDVTDSGEAFSADVPGSATSYEANLLNTHVYHIQVTAIDAAGNESTVLSGEPLNIPEAPFGSGGGNGTGGSTVPNPFVIGVNLSSSYNQYNSETKQNAEMSTFGTSLENAVGVPLKPLIKAFFYFNVGGRADANKDYFSLYEVAGETLAPVPVNVTASSTFEERRYLFVSPVGTLKPLTTYKLVIGRQIMSNNNRVLGYDKEVYFTTGAVNTASEVNLTAGAVNSYVTIGSGTPTEVTVSVPREITDAALDLSSLLNQAETGTTAQSLPGIALKAAVPAVSATQPVEIRIPQGVSVTGSVYWNGLFNVPRVIDPAITGVTVTPDKGKKATIDSVIEVGGWSVPLTTDKAVRIVFPGQAGKSVGYFRDGVFAKIGTSLKSDTQEAGDALPEGGDGRIVIGDDLVVWTKHFTQFVLYTQTADGSGEGPISQPGPTGVTPTPAAEVQVKPVLDAATGVAAAKIDPAALADAFAQAKADKDGTKTVQVKLAKVEGASAYAANLPSSVLTQASADQKIELKTDVATLTVPGNMLASLGQLQGKEVSLRLAPVDKSSLSEEARKAVGSRPVVELGVLIDGKSVAWSNKNASVVVSIPYAPSAEEKNSLEHLTVLYIDDAGVLTPVPSGKYDASTGQIVFRTTHFSRYAVAAVHKTFGDLDNTGWAKNEIEVLASKGIIKGTSETGFAPGAAVTRADYLTLLVRTLGLTAEVKGNFSDVKEGAYYYEAVGIAKALGIAEGQADGRFDPQATITRQDMMVLTERALKKLGKLEAAAGSAASLESFADKADIAAYAKDSLAALVKEGLITGAADGIHPKSKATRAEAAVFLYRIYNK
ncbi:hypothetical protein J2Z22_004652 [Paenibacillus forsythiae]|uniref:S-layer homology domain-containing protein n=1 Tax=Paenibacillus forsythiae TaxID=365616 RepID=A0ABU3HE23_9BACL|nr:hypothetical protein [Paenibacillus forsythiae]